MNWLNCRVIEQVQGKLLGIPLIRQSRVRPEDLLSNLDLTEAELAEEFDLRREDVHEVLDFWRRHRSDVAPHP